jgi:hypothetical protein
MSEPPRLRRTGSLSNGCATSETPENKPIPSHLRLDAEKRVTTMFRGGTAANPRSPSNA